MSSSSRPEVSGTPTRTTSSADPGRPPDDPHPQPVPAFDAEGWVDRHGDALYRWALIRLRHPEAAADVVQETFLAALDQRRRFEGRSSERTWLLGILKHKIGDVLRRRSRESPADGATPAARRPEGGPFDRLGFWERGPRRWGDPGSALESAEFWEVFQGCLAALPEHLAETFLLRELEGRDGPEVCQALSISPESFWKRMHRARLLLRECLERRWFDAR
jgi:RNA polymerase sigma-70 factor (ECF subfamily)